MFPAPFYGIVYGYLNHLLRKSVTNRHGNPLPALGGLQPVSVLPFVLFVLDIFQVAEGIGPVHFVKIAEPWQVLRLVNCNDH